MTIQTDVGRNPEELLPATHLNLSRKRFNVFPEFRSVLLLSCERSFAFAQARNLEVLEISSSSLGSLYLRLYVRFKRARDWCHGSNEGAGFTHAASVQQTVTRRRVTTARRGVLVWDRLGRVRKVSKIVFSRASLSGGMSFGYINLKL